MRIPANIIAAILSATLLFGTGCTAAGPRFVDDGTSYDARSAISLLESSDAGRLAVAPVEDSEDLRQDALAALRRRGGVARDAAQLLTETFAAAARGVPYYVERARYDGEDGWIVLEASGRGAGTLSDRRLWVLDAQGRVLLFSSR